MNSYQKLITHLKAKDYEGATGVFREIMEQKVAIRLAEERKRIAKSALAEAKDERCDKCKKKASCLNCHCGCHDPELDDDYREIEEATRSPRRSRFRR